MPVCVVCACNIRALCTVDFTINYEDIVHITCIHPHHTMRVINYSSGCDIYKMHLYVATSMGRGRQWSHSQRIVSHSTTQHAIGVSTGKQF